MYGKVIFLISYFDAIKCLKNLILKNLEDDLKSELSGNFLKGVLALLMPTDQVKVIF